MRLDLLWWRHLRPPRPHVAEERVRVTDMSKAITMLDPDTSAFTTMLMKLQGAREIVLTLERARYFPVGTLVRESDGLTYKVTASEWARPDDWFDTSVRLVLNRYPSPSTIDVKHYWLEDQLFPRVKEMP